MQRENSFLVVQLMFKKMTREFNAAKGLRKFAYVHFEFEGSTLCL